MFRQHIAVVFHIRQGAVRNLWAPGKKLMDQGLNIRFHAGLDPEQKFILLLPVNGMGIRVFRIIITGRRMDIELLLIQRMGGFFIGGPELLQGIVAAADPDPDREQTFL